MAAAVRAWHGETFGTLTLVAVSLASPTSMRPPKERERDLKRAVVSVFAVKSSAFGSVPFDLNALSEASVTANT